MPNGIRQKPPRGRAAGQNLAELALSIPVLFAVIFGALELAHAWQAYEAAKLAAMDGAYTAAMFDDATLGDTQLKTRLSNAGITLKNSTITPVLSNTADPDSRIGYEAAVTVTYQPMFGGISIPTMSAPIVIIPSAFDIQYAGIGYRSVY